MLSRLPQASSAELSRIVVGEDERVGRWMFETSGSQPIQFNMAVGLEENGELVGGVMFTGFNSSDVEIHFYGPGTLTRRVVRLIFGLALMHFNVNRVTVRTRKQHMSRGVLKLGAIHEGTVRRLYGPSDEACHAGEQYAFFRETIVKLSGLKEPR